MEKLYKDATKLLEKEIKEIVSRDELDAGNVEMLYKLLDNVKDISIICAMRKEEEDEYSERYGYDDDSYARRYAGRRDSRGRYARDSYDYNYGRNSYEGYSRTEDLERMMRDAKTEKERDLIRQLMEAKQS